MHWVSTALNQAHSFVFVVGISFLVEEIIFQSDLVLVLEDFLFSYWTYLGLSVDERARTASGDS